MSTKTSLYSQQNNLPLLVGTLFLIGFWWFGFDGITFSDDVYYILAGKSFWEGTMEVNSYHFSSRWGAYIPSGLLGYLFGLDPHIISGFSLLCYLITLWIVLQLIREKHLQWLFVIWFCTQVYFLHFITKVYPDASLVLWVTLVPILASRRNNQPVFAGIGLVLALFAGFLTKETIIFLAPFPLILLYLDHQNKTIQWGFYLSILFTGIILSITYLAYFWIEFGDPLYRVSSINAGHYISEFTYADKGIKAILKRLTITPFLTFAERAYWPWLVFAIPGMYIGLQRKHQGAIEFSMTFICLLLGFWFMSSTLAFYNPIYLNPRHLIILVPALAFLVAIGWNSWQYSKKWKLFLSVGIGLGILIALLQGDAKQTAFITVFLLVVWFGKRQLQYLLLSFVLLAPALFSVYYQKELKQYEVLIDQLHNTTLETDNQLPILVNNFIDFSKDILIPINPPAQERLIPIENFPQVASQSPPSFQVFIYNYYLHSYPKETEDLGKLNQWLERSDYQLIEERKEGQFWWREYRLK